MDAFPDLATLSDEDLHNLIEELKREEQEVSYRRRILHGKIDMLKVELQARAKSGKSAFGQVDVEKLADILAGKSTPSA